MMHHHHHQQQQQQQFSSVKVVGCRKSAAVADMSDHEDVESTAFVCHCRTNRLHLLFIFIILFIGKADATCNEEQIHTCRQAAMSDRLGSLRSSGECMTKQYMEFSHLCSVTNYLPTVDFCCCRYRQQLLLCCRYHQNWNQFRCQEADDVVITQPSQKDSLIDLPSMEILLPSTLIPILVLLVCSIVCLVSCCWCRRRRKNVNINRSAEPNSCCCCCSSTCFTGSRRQKRGSNPSRSNSEDTSAPLAPRFRPLDVCHLPEGDNSSAAAFSCSSCTATDQNSLQFNLLELYASIRPPGAEPTAPSAADIVHDFITPSAADDVIRRPHHVSSSLSGDGHCLHCACVGRPYFRSVDVRTMCTHVQPLPPSYDESCNHRIVSPSSPSA